MKFYITATELWFWRILTPLLILWCAFNTFYIFTDDLNSDFPPVSTTSYEGKDTATEDTHESMGCHTYWRAKGYSCYHY